MNSDAMPRYMIYREYHASVKFIGEETCRNSDVMSSNSLPFWQTNKFDINIHWLVFCLSGNYMYNRQIYSIFINSNIISCMRNCLRSIILLASCGDVT